MHKKVFEDLYHQASQVVVRSVLVLYDSMMMLQDAVTLCLYTKNTMSVTQIPGR